MSKNFPIIYGSNEVAFTSNGLGALTDGQSCEVIETINGTFELSLEYPVKGVNYKEIALNRIIYSKYSPYSNRQPFRIYYISKPHSGIITIKAEHRSYELRYYPCMPKTDYISEAGTCAGFMSYLTTQAADVALSLNTIAYTFSTDISTSKQWAITSVTDIKSAMMYAASVFEGEWEYQGTQCILKARRGADRGVKVRYNTNLVSFNETKKDYTYSDILPYWTDGTNYKFLTNPYLPIPSVSGTLNKGAKPVNLSAKFESEPTEADLLAEAINCDEYKNAPKPVTSQSVSFVSRSDTDEYKYFTDIDHVELGDDIETKIDMIDVDDTERCCQTVYNVYKNVYKYVTLGEVKKGISSTIAKDETESREQKWFASDVEPTADYQAGDFWIKIDNTTNRKAISLGRFAGNAWKLLCKFLGGVGENIGQHNERHNDYSTNGNGMDAESLQRGSDYNAFRNVENRVIDSRAYACDFSGVRNQVLATNPASGTPQAGQAFAVDLGGEANKARGSVIRSFLRGYNNTIENSNDSGVLGEYNEIKNSESAFVTGTYNYVNSTYYASALGHHCTADVNGSVAIGYYGNTNHTYIFAVGNQQQQGNVFAVMQGPQAHCYAYGYDSFGADYAEYFEWVDGNHDNEDRMGLLVMVNGRKIEPAHGTEFFGAISARASVVGNAYEDYWHGKYLTDVYGRMITDEHGAVIINPEYDPDREYVPRSERPEWDVVGIIGCIIIRDDGSCKQGAYVSARKGIGTSCYAKTPARVLRRIDKNHVEVLIK